MPARRSNQWAEPREARASEHQEQVTFVQVLRVRHPEIYQHMTAVPHGGHRAMKTAKGLKAEGVRDGYPDLLIDRPRGPFHGLRVEMKRRRKADSKVLPAQRQWGEILNRAGYLAVLGRGCDHALEQTLAYWELGAFDPAVVVDLSNFEVLLER